MKSTLLVVDLDDTLLGDEVALDAFAAWYAARRKWLELIYASGRSYESVMQTIRTAPLPVPEALICDVGTDLRNFKTGLPLEGWRERIARGWSVAQVRAACATCEDLVLERGECQGDFKVSYSGHQLTFADLARIYAVLRAAGLSVNLTYSHKQHLDIVPAGVDKGAATAYIVRRGGWRDRQVLVAGDSGRDVGLFQQGFRGIVVANAEYPLRRLAGPLVYVSPFSFAYGVLDGLCHWLGQAESGCLRGADGRPAYVAEASLAIEADWPVAIRATRAFPC